MYEISLRSFVMRIALLALALLVAPAHADEAQFENKPILNAAHVLRHMYQTDNNRVLMITPNKLALGGNDKDSVTLIAKRNKCTYEIQTSGRTGLRVDFSLVSSEYVRKCHWNMCTMHIFAADGGVCMFGKPNSHCYPSLQILGTELSDDVIGALKYIWRDGCGPYVKPEEEPPY